MKANEFRIGIWVSHNGKHILCDEDFLEVLLAVRNYEVFEPIPLTEEWMLRLGGTPKGGWIGLFVKSKIYDEECEIVFEFMGNTLCLYVDDNRFMQIDNPTVHQLQNLYYALTGEELNTK